MPRPSTGTAKQPSMAKRMLNTPSASCTARAKGCLRTTLRLLAGSAEPPIKGHEGSRRPTLHASQGRGNAAATLDNHHRSPVGAAHPGGSSALLGTCHVAAVALRSALCAAVLAHELLLSALSLALRAQGPLGILWRGFGRNLLISLLASSSAICALRAVLVAVRGSKRRGDHRQPPTASEGIPGSPK